MEKMGSLLRRLTLVPHRLTQYTDPLETSRTLSLGIVGVFIDLHQYRTLWVRTVLSGKRVKQFPMMLCPKGVSELGRVIVRWSGIPK